MVVAVVVMVRVTSTGVLPAGMLDGEKVQVVCAGRPEQAKVIVVAVDGVGVKVKCSVAVCPAVTVTDASVGVNEKLSGSITVTTADACAVAPFVSVTVSNTVVLPCG